MVNVCVHLYVTEEQANKCEYPASGLAVRFRPEQISAVTGSVPELAAGLYDHY